MVVVAVVAVALATTTQRHLYTYILCAVWPRLSDGVFLTCASRVPVLQMESHLAVWLPLNTTNINTKTTATCFRPAKLCASPTIKMKAWCTQELASRAVSYLLPSCTMHIYMYKCIYSTYYVAKALFVHVRLTFRCVGVRHSMGQ